MTGKATAEVINLEERRMSTSGDDGGFDHFSTMVLGTVFCCHPNGSNSSQLDEYMLCAKQGLTVLLQCAKTSEFERHLGNKFWKQNTLIQILHIPDPEKERQEDG